MDLNKRMSEGRRLTLSLSFLLLVCVFMPALCGAAERSIGQLSQSLESLRDSANHLVVVNDKLIDHTNSLKDKVSQLRHHNARLEQNNTNLQNELADYQEKVKSRSGLIEQNQSKIDEIRKLLLRMDQEIEMKKMALVQKTKQQEYVFRLLKIVEGGGTVDQNIETVRITQSQLNTKMELSRGRVQDLEKQWKELSFWYGDASQTVQKLKETRDQLQERLVQLKEAGVSESWSGYQAQIRQLNRDVKELSKTNILYQKTLKGIEKKYVARDLTQETRNEEIKLQQTLTRLKKDNKFLQKQASDLRLEMINLDKKKSTLELALSEKTTK